MNSADYGVIAIGSTIKNNKILMSRGTALWLKKNTNLTTKQIAASCGLTEVDVIIVNDTNTKESDPIRNKQFIYDAIKKCEQDSLLQLQPIFDLSRIYTPKYAGLSSRKVIDRIKLNNEYLGVMKWVIENHQYQSGVTKEAMVTALKIILRSNKSHITKQMKLLYSKYSSVNMIDPIEIHLCDNKIIITVVKNAYKAAIIEKICNLPDQSLCNIIRWINSKYPDMMMKKIIKLLCISDRRNKKLDECNLFHILDPVESGMLMLEDINLLIKNI